MDEDQTVSVLKHQTINGEELQGEAQAQAALSKEAYVIDPKVVMADEEPPELDPRTGVPKVLKSYLVHKDPKIYLIPNFVSDAEIEHLLDLAEEYWFPSVVGTGVYRTNDESKDLSNKASQNRTSCSCMLRSAQTPMVEGIEQRLSAVAGTQVDHLESLNMVRYMPGQFFNKHHDGRFRPKTVFIYLNDLPEGDDGETFFPELKLRFKPSKGCAIMWTNTHNGKEDMRLVHQGLPPRTSMKLGVNCFFNDKPIKLYEGIFSCEDDQEDIRTTVEPLSLAEDEGPAEPGQLRSFTVHNNPKISVVPNFLSAHEACALRAVLTKELVEDEEVYGRIEQRCALLAGVEVENMDPIKVARSEPNTTPDGLLFADTQDGSYLKRFGQQTISIFLNDVSEGGELRFHGLSLQVRPREGTAVLWSAMQTDGSEDLRAAHQGRPPKVGTRYTATLACRASVFRDRQ